MLYLIRSFGRNGKSYLKVGFTDNIANRMQQYKIHNPLSELITTRQGEQVEEKLLQLYLDILGYKANFLNEWFIDDFEILQKFHVNIDKKLKKFIWNNRNLVFKISDFSNKLMRYIFEELRSLFWSGKYTEEIDKQWKFAESQELIKFQKKASYSNFKSRIKSV